MKKWTMAWDHVVPSQIPTPIPSHMLLSQGNFFYFFYFYLFFGNNNHKDKDNNKNKNKNNSKAVFPWR